MCGRGEEVVVGGRGRGVKIRKIIRRGCSANRNLHSGSQFQTNANPTFRSTSAERNTCECITFCSIAVVDWSCRS